MVRGDSTGDVVFYGKGAGKFPTASAVVADVIDCVKHFKARKYLFWGEGSPDYVEDSGEYEAAEYIRLRVPDIPAVQKQVAQDFAGCERLARKGQEPGESAFVTPVLKEKTSRKRLDRLSASGVEVLNTIRIGDF